MKRPILFAFFSTIVLITNQICAQIDTAWTRIYEVGAWDELQAVTTDSFGNSYATGNSYAWGTGSDIITIKYTSNGTREWIKRLAFSSSGFEQGKNIAFHNGNIYVSGFSSAGGSTALGQFFLIKYSASGDSIWSYIDNNTSEGEPTAMRFDSEGNIILAGYDGSQYSDFITMKIDDSGNQVWLSKFNRENSGGVNKIYDMCMDEEDNIYVTGMSDVYLVSPLDITTIKYNSNGDSLWVRHFNGSANYLDAGRIIRYHNSGYIYVGGKVTSSQAPYSDMAIIKYDTSGTLIWSKTYNNMYNSFDELVGLEIDNTGNVFAMGNGSKSGDVTKNFIELVKYNPAGDTLWSRNFDLQGADQAVEMIIDASSNLYIAAGTFFNTSNGAYNGLACKYDSSGNLIWQHEYNGPLNNEDQFYALALDNVNDLICVGRTKNDSTTMDLLTIKYRNSIAGNPVINSEHSETYLNCYPNPANEVVYFNYYTPSNEAIDLRIFDMLGNEVYSAKTEKNTSGANAVQLNSSSFTSGIYMCTISNGFVSAQTKLILIK